MNKFLNHLREQRGISQKELAAILGISSSAISQWEECKFITPENLYKLSKIFQVSVQELLDEKLSSESDEEKWKRTYDLEEFDIDYSYYIGDDEALSQYFEIIYRMNKRFYKLAYQYLTDSLNDGDFSEWNVLKKYYEVDSSRDATDTPLVVQKISLEQKLEELKQLVWGDEEESIWKLQAIFVNSKDNNTLPSDNAFPSWFKARRQFYKDKLLTMLDDVEEENLGLVYQMIRLGGKRLYTNNDFSMWNFSMSELKNFEGKPVSQPNLDVAYEIVFKTKGSNYQMSYEEYQEMINTPRMNYIIYKMQPCKNKLECWEKYRTQIRKTLANY